MYCCYVHCSPRSDYSEYCQRSHYVYHSTCHSLRLPVSQFVIDYKNCVKANKRRREAPKKQKVIKVLTRDEFAQKFSDLQVDLAPHPLLGTTSKTMG